MAVMICLMAACGLVEALDDLRLGHFFGAGFDHHEAILAARDDEVEFAFLPLSEGRVDDVLPVEETDTHAGDRLLERNLRQARARQRLP